MFSSLERKESYIYIYCPCIMYSLFSRKINLMVVSLLNDFVYSLLVHRFQNVRLLGFPFALMKRIGMSKM